MAVILTISAKAGDAETSAVPIVSAATSRVKTWLRIAFSLFVSGTLQRQDSESARLNEPHSGRFLRTRKRGGLPPLSQSVKTKALLDRLVGDGGRVAALCRLGDDLLVEQ